ncbi:hypothetical protein B0H14DRAFT_2962300 [Mycena olivaceomarginata]|nr:hypothetical protein B0H14DRAFT_2962300 [Mycena olivaceomarginata]
MLMTCGVGWYRNTRESKGKDHHYTRNPTLNLAPISEEEGGQGSQEPRPKKRGKKLLAVMGVHAGCLVRFWMMIQMWIRMMCWCRCGCGCECGGTRCLDGGMRCECAGDGGGWLGAVKGRKAGLWVRGSSYRRNRRKCKQPLHHPPHPHPHLHAIHDVRLLDRGERHDGVRPHVVVRPRSAYRYTAS